MATCRPRAGSTCGRLLPQLPFASQLLRHRRRASSCSGRIDRATLNALAFATSISGDVTAAHVSVDPEDVHAMRAAWERWGGPVNLVILESPYRALIAPLMAYIEATDRADPGEPTTIVLPEFVPRHFWEYPLHNQTALRLKLRLFFRRNTVVVDVPYHLG